MKRHNYRFEYIYVVLILCDIHLLEHKIKFSSFCIIWKMRGFNINYLGFVIRKSPLTTNLNHLLKITSNICLNDLNELLLVPTWPNVTSREYSPSSKTTVQRRSLQMTDAFLRYEEEKREGFRWKTERPNNIQVITGTKYANHPRDPVTEAICYVCDRGRVVFCWYRSNSEIIHSWLERLRMKVVCRDVVSCLCYLRWARDGEGAGDVKSNVKVGIKGKLINLKLKVMIFFNKFISTTNLLNHIVKPSLIL